jgi:hypothetical protein
VQEENQKEEHRSCDGYCIILASFFSGIDFELTIDVKAPSP